ncbi:uncharacterized protein LOC135092678 [Scylla paramamosain]|uniref:uncharacterized protein LOC135092678 n=1 Tax=Scylla paramamosain TaxID=85552 RepID=UPI003083646E
MVGVGSSSSSSSSTAAVIQVGPGGSITSATANPTMRKLTAAHLSTTSLHPQGVARRTVGPGGGAVVQGHTSDGQLSREEVERRLAARQPLSDFTTTTPSLTLPNQLFSDNIMEGDFMEEEVETSPSNIEDDVTVDNYD